MAVVINIANHLAIAVMYFITYCTKPNLTDFACCAAIAIMAHMQITVLAHINKITQITQPKTPPHPSRNHHRTRNIRHINNDGAAHRKKINGHNHGGVDMGSWLKRNNYPEGFQVLCVNCNHAKGRIGEQALYETLRQAGRIT
jgi:hypothetical protein